jgi:hypothetical protein
MVRLKNSFDMLLMDAVAKILFLPFIIGEGNVFMI